MRALFDDQRATPAVLTLLRETPVRRIISPTPREVEEEVVESEGEGGGPGRLEMHFPFVFFLCFLYVYFFFPADLGKRRKGSC